MVKKLLKKELDIETISDLIGLSVEEIKKYKEVKWVEW